MSFSRDKLGTIVPDFNTNAIQKQFMECSTTYQNFSGGFGSGKTTACNFKIYYLSLAMPNNLAVICRSTYPDLRDTTLENFNSLVKREHFKSWRASEHALTLVNGSVVLFRHFENGSIKVGASIGAFFIDQAEEADENIFKALVGRLRRPVKARYGLLAMNPNGRDWQYDMFVKRKDPDYSHFDSTTFDNKANLPENYIEGMLRSYSQEWIDRYVYGKWNDMSGLIFHEFDEDRHLVDPFDVPGAWVKVRGNDWGVDAPATCVFIAQSPEGVYYVFDEYGMGNRTPEEHAKTILDISGQYGTFRASVLDSSAYHREKDLKSVADRYQASGYVCLPATRDVLSSITNIKQLLKTNRLKFVRGKTEHLLGELRKWKWGPRKNGKEVPTKGDDHYLDAMRYAIYWMDRKKFYAQDSVGESVSRPRAVIGPYYHNPMSMSDPVTGLPA